jgi:hypothetical protein
MTGSKFNRHSLLVLRVGCRSETVTRPLHPQTVSIEQGRSFRRAPIACGDHLRHPQCPSTVKRANRNFDSVLGMVLVDRYRCWACDANHTHLGEGKSHVRKSDAGSIGARHRIDSTVEEKKAQEENPRSGNLRRRESVLRAGGLQRVGMRQTMVIGPTPPGTGMIAPAACATSAKPTSPTIFDFPCRPERG